MQVLLHILIAIMSTVTLPAQTPGISITVTRLSSFATVTEVYELPAAYSITHSELHVIRSKESWREMTDGDILTVPRARAILTTLKPGDSVSFINVTVTKGTRRIKLAPKNFTITAS